MAFITIWRSALVNNPIPLKTQSTTVTVKDSGLTQSQPTQAPSTINSNSSGNSSLNSSGISSITQTTTINVAEIAKKNNEQVIVLFTSFSEVNKIPVLFLQPLATTVHFVEGFGLVMLCNCRPYPRKLAVVILKEIKLLARALGLPETEPPLIDAIDKCCPQVNLVFFTLILHHF